MGYQTKKPWDTEAKGLAGVFDGSYQRYYKSAPLPSKAKDGFVTLVVGRSFNEIVLDPKRDVMLMVYAKW